MSVWVVLTLVLFLGFFGWQSWRGFRHGAVLSRYGDYRRDADPMMFWFLLVLHTSGAAILTIVLFVFVFRFGIRF